MTLPSQLSWSGPYLADNVQTVFPYAFRIDQATELEVWQGDASGLVTLVPPSAYTVSGIGAENGGDVTYAVAPQAGLRIFPRRARPYSQTTDYRTGDPFLAETHEGTYDDVVQLVQQLIEEVSRRPALPYDSLAALRGLFFPRPQPLKIWGWDAQSPPQVTYYDTALLTLISVSDVAPLAWGKSVVDVPASAGAFQLPTPQLVFPAGCIRFGAMVRVVTQFGASQGLTTFSAGSPDTIDRWGFQLANTVTQPPVGANNPGMWTDFKLAPVTSGENVVLSADTGTFDAVGLARVTGLYLTMGAE